MRVDTTKVSKHESVSDDCCTVGGHSVCDEDGVHDSVRGGRGGEHHVRDSHDERVV